MPIQLLGTYRAVCDNCGETGSTWTTLQEHEKYKVIPSGWEPMPLNAWYNLIGRPRVPGNNLDVVICATCLEENATNSTEKPEKQ